MQPPHVTEITHHNQCDEEHIVNYSIIGTVSSGKTIKLASYDEDTTFHYSNHLVHFSEVAQRHPRLPKLECRTDTGTLLIRRTKDH